MGLLSRISSSPKLLELMLHVGTRSCILVGPGPACLPSPHPALPQGFLLPVSSVSGCSTSIPLS